VMRLFALLALVAALAVPAAASAANQPHPVLDSASTEIAGRPVRVHCETNEAQWIAWQLQFGSILHGFTYFDQPVTYISPRWCWTLRSTLVVGYREVGVASLSMAVSVLVHEAVHQRGIRDECQTEKIAQTLVMGVAERYFNLTRTVPEIQHSVEMVWRTVRRKIAGKWRKIRVRVGQVRTETVLVPNPDYARFQVWVTAWHNSLPPQYLGC
jgi:hypothetical protein